MAELALFIENISEKSANTQKTYKTQYNKLINLLGKNVAESSEKKVMEVALDQPNNNQRQALIKIAILIRRLEKLSTTKLEDLREKLKVKINTNVKEKNIILQDTLPSYQDLIEFTEYLYAAKDHIGYAINYLLINYQVRNQDLVFDIVKTKDETKDDTKNYMLIGKAKLTYIRNNYKTKDVYGQKIIIIKDSKFISVVKNLLKDGKDCIVPNLSQVGYYVQKATYKQLGEGNYFKIILNHFRADFGKLREISENRGTSLDTMSNSYDIQNVENDLEK